MPSVDVASLFEKQTPVEYSVDLSAFRSSRASREANTEKQEDVKTIQEEHAGKQQDEEKNSRTLFIGNLPAVCCTDKRMQTELRRKLSAYGAVESLRFRSVAFKPSASRRTAFITGKMDERAVSVNAYAVMETRVHAEEAASKENGRLFQQRHLRVDLADSKSVALVASKIDVPFRRRSRKSRSSSATCPSRSTRSAFGRCLGRAAISCRCVSFATRPQTWARALDMQRSRTGQAYCWRCRWTGRCAKDGRCGSPSVPSRASRKRRQIQRQKGSPASRHARSDSGGRTQRSLLVQRMLALPNKGPPCANRSTP